MRGFQIEKTKGEIPYSTEGLPGKILKVPGMVLVAAGTESCLRTLYDTAERVNALDRLFLCKVSPMEYSCGKQGTKIWNAIECASKMPGTRGIIIYASCMEVLTMWDFEREYKKNSCEIPVEILYRGPMVKRFTMPSKELDRIFSKWDIFMDWEKNQAEDEKQKKYQFAERIRIRENFSEAAKIWKPQLPYFAQEIQKLKNQDCDILLFTPGGCKSCLESLPGEILENVWNTRFTDYVLSQGNMKQIMQEILDRFPQKRPLYLMESEVVRFMGMDLQKVTDDLNKAGKEACYIPENSQKRQ